MAVEMCIAGATPADLPTFVGWSVIDVDCSNNYTGQYFDTDWVALGTTLPGPTWRPCSACGGSGSGGGGGGGGSSVASINFEWQQGTFEDGGSTTSWPDGGTASSVEDERWTLAPIAGAYTTWTCLGIRVAVHNVLANTTGDIVVTLTDEASNVYATVTITSGTSPDSPSAAAGIVRAATSTQAAVAGTRLQWVVADAPLNNDFWVEAIAIGVLT